MNQNLTEIICIIDRSGSMSIIQHDMEGGFNKFIEDQKKVVGEAVVTLAQFDDRYDLIYDAKPIKDVGKYTLTPRGSTALLDAIGKTILAVGERLAKTEEDKRPGKVITVIVTDGEENHSKEFTKDQILKMISHQHDTYKWEFIYLGANQDAISVANGLGICTSANYMADAKGVYDITNSLSASVVSYRTTGTVGKLPENIQ